MHVVALCLLAATFMAAEPEAVVLEFTAPSRCPPCQQIAPTVSRLQREGFPIKAIDVDTQPSAAAPYRLRAVPTFVLIIAGREVDRIEGKPEELELRRMCDRARLANAATEVTNGSHDEPTNSPPALKKAETSVAPQSEPARPTPPTTNKLATGTRGDAGKSEKDKTESAGSRNEPVIRAKHDGSTILPDASSTDPRHVSPRIRVKDSHGVNFGTGTIIDSREGRTTILTCGHIFRKLDDKSVIEVDVFNGTKHETFVGRLIRSDLDADVGLLWIPTSRTLPAASIASLTTAATVGQHVFSVGCSGGDAPTKLQHKVTALNRYLGPDNIECTGVPVQGRSGGGLFDTAGHLVGVCIAADQRDQRGLFAGLKPIHDLVNQVQLAQLLPKAEPRPRANWLDDDTDKSLDSRSALASAESPFSESPKDDRKAFTESPFSDLVDSSSPANSAASPFAVKESTEPQLPPSAASSLSAVTPAEKSDLKNPAELPTDAADSGEAEVVCIIRPLNNPRAVSRVVIINRASTKFLSQLSGELEQQAKPTSAVIRHAKYPSEIRPYRRTK